MTNLDKLIKQVVQYNFVFLLNTSGWDVYNSNIGKSKNSNIYKDVADIFKKNKDIEKVWVKITSHSRNQHGESGGGIFDVTNADIENSGYEYSGTYFKRADFNI